jgi:hypothetical protein
MRICRLISLQSIIYSFCARLYGQRRAKRKIEQIVAELTKRGDDDAISREAPDQQVQEESYTSKASFLDLDPIPVYGEEDEKKPVFSGGRIKRDMYQSKSGKVLNADVNGSYNTMRKALPNVFTDNGIEDVNKTIASLVVHPERIVIPLRTQRSRIR